MDKIAHEFKTPVSELEEKISKLVSENKNLQSELDTLKADQVKAKFQSFVSKAEDVSGGKLFISEVEAVPPHLVKLGAEILSHKLGTSIVILASKEPDKITFVVKADDDFVKKGINAGQIVSKLAEATGGRGGGRPQFAQGAGKDTDKLQNALIEIEKEVKASL